VPTNIGTTESHRKKEHMGMAPLRTPLRKGLQSLADRNNPPVFVFANGEQRSIAGDEEVSLRCKRGAYHDIVVGIRCDAGYWSRAHQYNQFHIKIDKLVNRQQRRGNLSLKPRSEKNFCQFGKKWRAREKPDIFATSEP
jgi:hypothetical protein